jgi:membrane protein implicated in regulation of membrane protease activity
VSGLALVCALIALPVSMLGVLWLVRAKLGSSEDDQHRSDGAGAISNALMIPMWLFLHIYWMAGLSVLLALLFAWDWWRKRKRRKRSPKALGAKSRALIAALVRKAREAARPRPVLRPQPGGAR